MNETLQVRSKTNHRRLGVGAGPLTADEQTQVGIENPPIEEIIRNLDDFARRTLREHLDTIYSEHAEKGVIRYGSTLNAGIEAFEYHAGKLIAALVEDVSELAPEQSAFELVVETVNQFLSLLDGELNRIAERVAREAQDAGEARRLSEAAGKVWAEKRQTLLENLALSRSKFIVQVPDMDGDEETSIDELHGEETPSTAADGPVPTGHQWHEMWTDIALQLWTGNLRPSAQSDLHRAMADWLKGQGIEPCEKHVHELARRLWQKYVATQRIRTNIVHTTRQGPTDQTAVRFDRSSTPFGSGSDHDLAGLRTGHFGKREIPCSVTIKEREASSRENIDGGPTGRLEPSHGIAHYQRCAIELTAVDLNID